jgi:hypothetical protein
VYDLEGKLFVNFTKLEAPKTPPPPLNLCKGTPLGSFSAPMAHIHKLAFPTYDGKEDPLPWINCCD